MAEIELEGMNELHLKFDRVTRKVLAEADEGLKRGGMKIIAGAQLNLKANGTNYTGLLSNSGKVQKIDSGYDVGFFAQGSKNGYAESVEYGQRAGRYPPVEEIRAWAWKKLRVDRKRLDSAAYLIRRKIARKGTRPQPFFSPAVKDNEREITDAVSEAIDKVTGRSDV